jgi:predicted TIM-barrel fold metal-dependent hydrolase
MAASMDDYSIERAIISYPNNQVAIRAQKKHPEKLCALAWINPNDGPKAAEDFEALAAAKLVAGLKLHPLFNAYTANDACVFPLAEAAIKWDLPIFIHSGHPPFSLPWSIGQLADLFPAARIVMVHMGHGHGVYIQAAIDAAIKYDNIWLETSGMPMHTKIKEACERVGRDRVFWGSDAPFHHYAVEALRTAVSGLSEPALEDVFRDNIKKFMRWQQ